MASEICSVSPQLRASRQPIAAWLVLCFASSTSVKACRSASAARCLIGSADVAVSAGESARAEKMYTDALSRCTVAQDDRGRADAMRGLAVVELQCGRAESALHAFTEFADQADRLGDRRWLQFAHRTKTWILELASAWSDGQEGWVPRAVEARPGIWVVGGYPD